MSPFSRLPTASIETHPGQKESSLGTKMSSPSRNSDPASQALLSSHEHDQSTSTNGHAAGDETAIEEPPVWKFWRRGSNFKQRRKAHLQGNSSGHVTWAPVLDEDEEGDEEDLSFISRRSSAGVMVVTYLAVLLLGTAFGFALRYGWDHRRDLERKDGDGPMVPPVYTLPPPTGLPRNKAYLINATTAAVASEDITCSNLGLTILQRHNGSAVDAAVTTTLCIGLLNAFSSGIGGGGFMVVRVPRGLGNDFAERDEVVWDREDDLRENGASGKVWAIDFRETSPEKSEKEMYGTERAGRIAAQVGGLAVGVPGELRGLEKAHKMYGKLPWKDVVMPVAELAKGWFVSRELARRIRIFGQFMLTNPTWSSVYAPRGTLLVEGDYIQRLAYGKTLEKIAHGGADMFYEGEIARSIVETVQREGGVLSLDDLRNFKAITYPAIHQTYHGQTIYTTNAPSSGGVMLGMLNILEPYNITSIDVLSTHRLLEAMKFAFGARSEITDPVFAKNLSRFEEFYSKAWGSEKTGLIDDGKTHSPDYYGLEHDTPVDHGTTHLSIVDQWGGAASVTSTINLIWGSHVMDPVTGVIMNDEQDDFSVPGAPDAFGLLPSPWNYPAPGKKPLSSTAPTIIQYADGSLKAVLGGSGGSRIFPSIAQVIVNLECGDDLSQAIERPRVHNQVVPAITTLEVGPGGVSEGFIEGLEDRGHVIGEFDINIGVAEVQAILLKDGKVYASSDSRKNGIAAGY